MSAKSVDLAGLHARNAHMPIVIGTVGRGIDRDHARGAPVVFPIEKQQLHAGSTAREDAEIHTAGNDGGSQRMALPCMDGLLCSGHDAIS
jgi:hypothetical protein